MPGIPQRHALAILYLAEKPVTQEYLTTMALTLGLPDTPQSLRSRIVELERDGYTHRVDRNGTSAHGRPCWRWQLTEKGKELAYELLNQTTTNEGR